jgi:hypothetical protein
MKIMLIEDNENDIFLIKRAFRRDMPEAELTVVSSIKEYGVHKEERFDAYICDNKMEGPDGVLFAFGGILPDISHRFPDAVLIHNSSAVGDRVAAMEEMRYRIRFARGTDGKIFFCVKEPQRLLDYIRTMVVDKGKSLRPPAQPATPTPERRKI